MGINYRQWINGNCGCNCGNNYSKIENCDCDQILLSISNLRTDIIKLSGDVENVEIDLTDYYTKDEVDALIPTEVSELTNDAGYITSASLVDYATKQWVTNQGYLKNVDLSNYALKTDIPTVPTNVSAFNNDAGYINQIKTINGVSLVGSGNIVISDGGTIDAYTKDEANARFALKTDLNDYVTISEFNQYITNLQQQINSLTAAISGCCSSSGETQYRWVTMTGENDYECSGTTKMTKEKQQSSTDGLNWIDTGNYRTGSTVLETNSLDCGYSPVSSYKVTARYNDGTVVNKDCDGSAVLRNQNFSSWENISGLTVGDCITELADLAFYGLSGLTTVSLPTGLTSIGGMAFSRCIALPSITIPTGVTSIGSQAFALDLSLTSITIPTGVTKLGYATLYDCTALTAVNLSNVQTLDNNAIANCKSLTSITLPATITSLGKLCLSFNDSLTSVTCLATTPPSFHDSGETGTGGNDGNILYGCHNLNAIYVPSASLNAYKAAWPSIYENLFVGI